jgi:hypothetical protein
MAIDDKGNEKEKNVNGNEEKSDNNKENGKNELARPSHASN